MSRELIKKLRNYADIAEVADKPHWADAMRKAAEYIKSDIEKPFPEPVAGVAILDGKPALVKIGKEDSYEGRLYAEPQARSPLSDSESYSDALRSLASYVGCGGYNANDPIDAKEFEEKIRLGIDLLLSAQSNQYVRKPLTNTEILEGYAKANSKFEYPGCLYSFTRGVGYTEEKHGIKGQE